MLGSRNRFGKWWVYLVVTVALVLVITPFVWMVLGSFKSEGELRRVPPTWWPEAASLDNYTLLFAKLDFATYFANSAIVAVVVTAGNLLFCSMLGYALAMLDFPGKKALLLLVLGTLMIPGVVTFVPLFVLVANAGLIDSLPGLFLPFLAAPFGVFLMRQFISGLPHDLGTDQDQKGSCLGLLPVRGARRDGGDPPKECRGCVCQSALGRSSRGKMAPAAAGPSLSFLRETDERDHAGHSHGTGGDRCLPTLSVLLVRPRGIGATSGDASGGSGAGDASPRPGSPRSRRDRADPPPA